MAKSKTPLLSLGARGSIGDTLTFQKRGRLTIARQKPIPTDPKTDLQLAHRQVYREAVAAWNALTPEEQEAYRSVCPGLTPYQCYMKTALAVPPAPPPPEEKIEEQTQYNNVTHVYGTVLTRGGQKLTIPGRMVTKLGFWLSNTATATGEIIYTIRRVSDDGIICSKVALDAGDLTITPTYHEVEWDSPVTIDEEVRLCVEPDGVGGVGYIDLSIKTTGSVKPDELMCYYIDSWTDSPTSDAAYRYKYYEVE
ncbi:hypothetical protein ES708_34246 [subsurface metagenome]